MKKMGAAAAAVLGLVAAAVTAGCISGSVATDGFVGALGQQGALMGYGQTMRCSEGIPSIQYHEKTTTSLFNSLSRDTDTRWMVNYGGVTNAAAAAQITDAVKAITSKTNVPGYYNNTAAAPVWSPASGGTGGAAAKAAAAAASALGAVTNGCAGGECGEAVTNCVDCAEGN